MKDERYLQFQETLRKNSAKLDTVNGYTRLNSSIENVADWDGFQAISAQIDITLWFNNKGILKEIEPQLPHREGYADILLSFSHQNIYCEVISPESLGKSMESKKQYTDNEKIKIKLQNQPYLTEQDIKHEIKKDRIIRNLLIKTKKQLPINHPGIIALETGKSMVFHQLVKEIARNLFPKRQNVILIMLWSLERGTGMGEPPFCYINRNSNYQNIGEELLSYLKQANNIIS